MAACPRSLRKESSAGSGSCRACHLFSPQFCLVSLGSESVSSCTPLFSAPCLWAGPTCESRSPAEPKALPSAGQPRSTALDLCALPCLRSWLFPWDAARALLGHHAPLLSGRQKKDVLTAQLGLDCVSVSRWGSRTSGPPGLGARLESKALGVGEGPRGAD